MNFVTYTIENNQLQTTILHHALTRAKEVAKKLKSNVPVLMNGKPYCKVAKNGLIIKN